MADDLDFAAQPMAMNLARARFTGVRYLIIITLKIKEKLNHENLRRIDFPGGWSIFEIPEGVGERAEALNFKPALAVSTLSYKGRSNNDLSFVRLAEEQFNDAWFEVLLVHSPKRKLDKLERLENFGALIAEKYEYDNENLAFEKLKEYSQTYPLILVTEKSALFERIKNAQEDFVYLTIFERPQENDAHPLNSEQPTAHYNESPTRKTWQEIRRTLETNKRTRTHKTNLQLERNNGKVTLAVTPHPEEKIPVLLRQSYHPNWRHLDAEPLFLASPFFTLVFTDQNFALEFQR